MYIWRNFFAACSVNYRELGIKEKCFLSEGCGKWQSHCTIDLLVLCILELISRFLQGKYVHL